MNTVTNLTKLADYIEQHVRQDQLNMRLFRSTGSLSEGRHVNFKAHNDCGTSGCALGWAPFVEGLEPVESEFNRANLNHGVPAYLEFMRYSARVFPDLHDEDEEAGEEAEEATEDWNEVFAGHLSSDKPEVIRRLRSKADQLEEQHRIERNRERIDQGAQAYEFFTRLEGADPDSPQDLVSDLLHFLYAEQQYTVESCEQVLWSAINNFKAEISE